MEKERKRALIYNVTATVTIIHCLPFNYLGTVCAYTLAHAMQSNQKEPSHVQTVRWVASAHCFYTVIHLKIVKTQCWWWWWRGSLIWILFGFFFHSFSASSSLVQHLMRLLWTFWCRFKTLRSSVENELTIIAWIEQQQSEYEKSHVSKWRYVHGMRSLTLSRV